MNLPTAIVCGYVGLLMAISFMASRLVKRGQEGFFLASRRLPASLVAVTLTGLAIGGASTVGVAQNAFAGQGISAGWYGVAWTTSALVVGLLVCRRYRELEVVTVPELFRRNYGQSGLIACVVVQILVQIVITSLQYVAGGAILHQLLPETFPSLREGMLFSAVVFIAVTIAGGLWSASLSNLLNVALIYGGIAVAAVLSLWAVGGTDQLVQRLPPDAHAWDPVAGIGWTTIAVFTLVMVTCNISFQATVQIALAARSGTAARNGFLLASIMILPVGFLAALIGVAARASFPDLDHAATALPRMVGSLHPMAAGITLASLWAADVSTATGLLLGSATIVVRHLLPQRRKAAPEAQPPLMLHRATVLVIGVITLLLAMQVQQILKALMQGLSLTTGPTVVVLMTFFAPQLCRRSSAVATITTGIIAAAVWFVVPAVRIVPHLIFFEWIVCLAVFFAVALVSRRSESSPQ